MSSAARNVKVSAADFIRLSRHKALLLLRQLDEQDRCIGQSQAAGGKIHMNLFTYLLCTHFLQLVQERARDRERQRERESAGLREGARERDREAE